MPTFLADWPEKDFSQIEFTHNLRLHMDMKRSSFLFSVGLLFLLGIGYWHYQQKNLVAKNRPQVSRLPTMPGNESAEPVEPAYDSLVPAAVVPARFLISHDKPTRSDLSALFMTPFEHDAAASFHPHGEKICASGCAVSNHPTPELKPETFQDLLKEYATGPLDETNVALEALLYYGNQTTALIDAHGFAQLDARHQKFLLSELDKTHARVAIRIVDEYGNVRAWNEVAKVPFNRRHVFHLEGSDLQPLVASGTVKRVGLYHIWARL
jgi:hypothetical protein